MLELPPGGGEMRLSVLAPNHLALVNKVTNPTSQWTCDQT